MTVLARWKIARVFFLFAVGSLWASFSVLLTGCDRRESLVVYVSADESVARPILAAFEEETGIRVDPVFDTEATKTTGIVQRLRAERDRPRADAFWSSEIALTVQLANEGVLAAALSPELDAWPTPYRDSEGRWFAFAARARVIVYSTERVSEADVPATWMDLTQSRWKDRIAMADPRFGTTRAHMGVLFSVWDRRVMPGYFDAWLEGLAENRIALLTSGNSGVVQAVAEGQFDVGMTDSDDVRAAQARGLKVAAVLPRHFSDAKEPGSGTLLIPNTCAMVAGTPHADNVKRLLAFLVSPACEERLFASDSKNFPLGPTLTAAAAKERPQDPLIVRWDVAAAATEAAVGKAIRRLQGAADRIDRPTRGRPSESDEDGSVAEPHSEPPVAPAAGSL